MRARGPITLAIEISNPSSGPRGRVGGVLAGPGVALGWTDERDEMRVIGEEPLREGGRHDDDLVPAIDRLCGRCGVRPRDLQRVAVSVGPGGYTSLRIAVATAKMIAEATGAEAVPVPSAVVAAWRASPEQAPAVVCLASKNQSAHGTLLAPAADEWWERTGRAVVERLAGPEAAAAHEADRRAGRAWVEAPIALGIIGANEVAALQPGSLIADRFLPEPMRCAAEGIGAAVIEPVFAAASVLEASIGRAAVDPALLVPIYPREPDAVTQWRRRKGGG